MLTKNNIADLNYTELIADHESAIKKIRELKSVEEKKEQWFRVKRGRFTASDIFHLLSYENKPDFLSPGAEEYIQDKVLDILTEGKSRKTFFSKSMNHGKEYELEAIAGAERILNIKFEKTGDNQEFIEYGTHAGATPDGISETFKAGIEVKCPDCKTHFKYLKIKNSYDLKRIEPKYYWQIQKGMLTKGFDVWYFISYDPRFTDPEKQLLLAEIRRNSQDIEFIKHRLKLGINRKLELLRE